MALLCFAVLCHYEHHKSTFRTRTGKKNKLATRNRGRPRVPKPRACSSTSSNFLQGPAEEEEYSAKLFHPLQSRSEHCTPVGESWSTLEGSAGTETMIATENVNGIGNQTAGDDEKAPREPETSSTKSVNGRKPLLPTPARQYIPSFGFQIYFSQFKLLQNF